MGRSGGLDVKWSGMGRSRVAGLGGEGFDANAVVELGGQPLIYLNVQLHNASFGPVSRQLGKQLGPPKINIELVRQNWG